MLECVSLSGVLITAAEVCGCVCVSVCVCVTPASERAMLHDCKSSEERREAEERSTGSQTTFSQHVRKVHVWEDGAQGEWYKRNREREKSLCGRDGGRKVLSM